MPFLTDDGARTIAPDQIEGAVWNAIIHGAAGIAYFQHNNNDACGTYSLVQCSQTLRDKVKSVDADIAALAPVINSPSYVWSFGPNLDTMLKASGNDAYVFAMTSGGTGQRTFTLPPTIKATSVEVVGENRTLPVTAAGTFTDTFAHEYTHHIYRAVLR
jgi:hypothetical protein